MNFKGSESRERKAKAIIQEDPEGLSLASSLLLSLILFCLLFIGYWD